MKICLFSPYVPKHKGGGEKYFFDVARALAEQGHQVSVAISSSKHLDEVGKMRSFYEDFLGYSLEKVAFIATPLMTSASFFSKLFWTAQFDLMYCVTDGSLFFSLAKKNILHIQIPFTDQKKNIMDRLKLRNWSIKNANSTFTKEVVQKAWKTPIRFVHYPMISLNITGPEKISEDKSPVILNVGRFFRQLHSKRQDVLVKMFRELTDLHPTEMKPWKLVLIGAVEDEGYAREVEELSKGYNIEIVHNAGREQLLQWYKKAMIYWHATGFEIDEKKNPEKVEHFGISTVEAMSFGCVPIVLGKGGQPEVLGYSLKELLWDSLDEGMRKTYHIIQHPDLRISLALDAIQQADQFNETRFKNTLLEMIH